MSKHVLVIIEKNNQINEIKDALEKFQSSVVRIEHIDYEPEPDLRWYSSKEQSDADYVDRITERAIFHLNNLTDEQRHNIISRYCSGCGTKEPCECWREL